MEKSSSMNNNNNYSMSSRDVFANNNEKILSSGEVSGEKKEEEDEAAEEEVVAEESGWTMYFEDFFNEYNYNNHHHDHGNSSSIISIGDHPENTLISDAASSAAKKFDRDRDHEKIMGFSLDRTCDRSSSFKKRKTKVVLLDHDLEDTASSPANSPKVYDSMDQFDIKSQHKHISNISQEKGSSSSRNVVEKKEERSGFGSINGRDNDTSELKKKGLCLVPLSMIVNYLD